MKIKNGFTFSEMLVVIALIGVIFLIAYPSVFFINKRINERLYNTKIELILSSAEMYAQDYDLTVSKTVTVNFLLANDYLIADKEKNEECLEVMENNKQKYSYGCLVNPIYSENSDAIKEKNKFLNDIEVIINIGSGGTYNAQVGEEYE